MIKYGKTQYIVVNYGINSNMLTSLKVWGIIFYVDMTCRANTRKRKHRLVKLHRMYVKTTNRIVLFRFDKIQMTKKN